MRSTQQLVKPLIAIIIVILISGNHNPSFGQGKKSIKKTFEIADQYLSAGDPENARVYYQQILDIDSANAAASYKIAECYRQMRNFDFALTFYDHAFQQDPAQYKDGLFYVALMDKYLENYPVALKKFDVYLACNPSDAMKFRATFEKNGVQLALDQSKKPEKNFQFSLVPRPVSTKYDEKAVVLAGDDQHIVVHINRNGSLSNQQFQRSENQWAISGENTLFNTLNSDKQVGSGTFNHTKNIFYFSKADPLTGNSRLYQSIFQNGTWQPPTLVELEYIDGPYHYEDPCLTPTGDTLIFSSDIPGGMGGFDLWYVTRGNDGNWGIIENLDEPINTAFDEKSPFYFPLQSSLFFSSNGHVGYGNFDIFFIQNPFDGKEIVNIGAPFNSPYNDQSMVLDGKFGFLASDRSGGNGGFDIYTFRSKATQFENYTDKAAVAQKNMQPQEWEHDRSKFS